MSNPFWSIDDYIEWRCAPEEDFTNAVSELREQLLLGKIELTGWRCSWDAYGQERENTRTRENVPILAIIDLNFNFLPDGGEFVLIPHNCVFGARRPAELSYSGGVTWLPIIEGWGELRLSADQVRNTWSRGDESSKPPETHSGMEGRPTPKRLYLAELERRISAKERLGRLDDESKALHCWLAAKFPSFNAGSWETVRNNIRERYREAELHEIK